MMTPRDRYRPYGRYATTWTDERTAAAKRAICCSIRRMTKTPETQDWKDRAGYFAGFALFVPALLVAYVVFAGLNRLVFGSLN
jgi:hypothetical protein